MYKHIQSEENCETSQVIVNSICQLEEIAFDILLSNAGCDKKKFMEILTKNHKPLIEDAFGNEPEEVAKSLMKLWETSYYDTKSEKELKLSEWAREFSTKEKIKAYIGE